MPADHTIQMHQRLIDATLGTEVRPALVTVAPRHAFNGCEGQQRDFIDTKDIVGDYDRSEGGASLRVLGFKNDKDGRQAQTLISELVGERAAHYRLDPGTMGYAPVAAKPGSGRAAGLGSRTLSGRSLIPTC